MIEVSIERYFFMTDSLSTGMHRDFYRRQSLRMQRSFYNRKEVAIVLSLANHIKEYTLVFFFFLMCGIMHYRTYYRRQFFWRQIILVQRQRTFTCRRRRKKKKTCVLKWDWTWPIYKLSDKRITTRCDCLTVTVNGPDRLIENVGF